LTAHILGVSLVKAEILIVDDDAEMLSALSEALTRAGFESTTANDGESALLAIENGNFSLVVSDIKMPRKNGLELLSDIKKDFPGLPIILMTAYGDAESATEPIRLGADDFLLKPFSFDVLESSIKNLLNNNQPSATAEPSVKRTAVKPNKKSSRERKIITNDPQMKKVLELVDKTAASRASVLIQGESGTGKELIARYIHQKSDRAGGAFVAVNCAALPEALLESELFGHEKGSFTGAITRKIGKFELADGGTILLDEITEMQIELQAKLLRVLQEKEIDRVGGSSTVSIDVRVVATTNRDPQEAISEGKFREDLYFRLNVIPVVVPPLRERPEDVIVMSHYFREKFALETGKNVKEISDETLEVLRGCRWRGNVRELENVMERAVLLSDGETIKPEDLFMPDVSAEKKPASNGVEVGGTIEAMERRMILGTLEQVSDNRTKAAEMLGISIRTLRNKLNIYKVGRVAE